MSSTITHEEWERVTHGLVEKAAKEIANSKQLRSYFDVLMKQVVEDMSKQVYKVNEVFRKRITEYRHAKSVLEEIHKQSAQKVNDINRNIADLEKEMMEKEGYVRVCQMRLGSRAQRPMTELCNDKVEASLLKEYRTLRETVVNLSQMISEVSWKRVDTASVIPSILKLSYLQSDAALRYLLQTQMLQEAELNRKTNMLKLYEVDCMTIREGIDFSLF